jgi:hypothetical protein
MMENRVVIRTADEAAFFSAAREAARRADRGEPFDGTITPCACWTCSPRVRRPWCARFATTTSFEASLPHCLQRAAQFSGAQEGCREFFVDALGTGKDGFGGAIHE